MCNVLTEKAPLLFSGGPKDEWRELAARWEKSLRLFGRCFYFGRRARGKRGGRGERKVDRAEEVVQLVYNVTAVREEKFERFSKKASELRRCDCCSGRSIVNSANYWETWLRCITI